MQAFILLIIAFVIYQSTKKSNAAKKGASGKGVQATGAQVEEPAAPAPALPKVLQPVAEPRLAPMVHVTPHDHSGMYNGSMEADDTGEGQDWHDHGFKSEPDMPSMHSEAAINESLLETPAEETVPGLALGFDRQSVAQALVMQEILTRPCQRTARR